jgi:phospholipase C
MTANQTASTLRKLPIFLMMLAAAALLSGCQGLVSISQPPPADNPALDAAINHVVFMVQENRSFDHYFGHLNAYRVANGFRPEVDGTPANASNPAASGSGNVAAFHLLTSCVENPSPSWNESHVDFNRQNPTSNDATLDGFVQTAAKTARDQHFHDVQGLRVMGYYDQSDLPYYYFMATYFATSDRWFSPVMSRTQPNRMFLLSATSAGHVYPLAGGTVLNNLTIFDELQQAGVSWKIYVTDKVNGSLLKGSYISMFAAGTKYQQNVVPVAQYFTDLNSGKLPQVALIESGYFSGLDEHPAENPNGNGPTVQAGAAYVSTFLNALMASSAWNHSAFIWTTDEGGGFYDHVAPQPAVSPDGIPPQDLQPNDICTTSGGGRTCDFTSTGYRVPMFVASPYARKGFVSHSTADYTAILKLIETRFHLRSLTLRDANQPDMTEFFDFSKPDWLTPPTPPVQPTNQVCYLDHLP